MNARLSRDGQSLLSGSKGIKEGLLATSGTWTWAWVIDGKERPPPSSIVARRDTEEARRLARFADVPLGEEESSLNANNLWSVLLNFLGSQSSKSQGGEEETGKEEKGNGEQGREKVSKRKAKFLSRFGIERQQSVAIVTAK